MKNVIWWVGIINPEHKEKYGGYDYFEYSKKTWEYWCEKNDCILYVYDKPSNEKTGMEYRVTWQ